jgi:hypothetical protein
MRAVRTGLYEKDFSSTRFGGTAAIAILIGTAGRNVSQIDTHDGCATKTGQLKAIGVRLSDG